jgi:hypothetical protein
MSNLTVIFLFGGMQILKGLEGKSK